MLQVRKGERNFGDIFSLNPRLMVSYGTDGAYAEEKYFNRDYHKTYYKDVVVIQSMILADDMFMCELMWKDDFEKMFE